MVTRAVVEAFICPQKVLPVITIKVDGILSIYLHGLIQQILIGYVPGIKQGFGDKKKTQRTEFLPLIKFPAEQERQNHKQVNNITMASSALHTKNCKM